MKPNCYKFKLEIPRSVYEFMISSKGVGGYHQLFSVGGKKYFHDPKERSATKYNYIAWYKRRKDLISVLVWLIDWYHAAAKRTDGVCVFPNWDLICDC